MIISDLLHGGDIDTLNIVFPGKDLIEDVVGEDFIIFNDHAHDDLFGTEGNFFIFDFLSPN